MEIKDRIGELLNIYCFSAAQFADNISVQRSTLSHILNGRNNPSLDIVMKIHERFPEVSIEWLLYGTGNPPISQQEPIYAEASLPANHSSLNETNSKTIDTSFITSLFNEEPAKGDLSQKIARNITSESKAASLKPEIQTNPKAMANEMNSPILECPTRKVTQIMLFYSDGTYETFTPHS